MGVSLYAFTCGELEGEFGRVMEGAEGSVAMPIPAHAVQSTTIPRVSGRVRRMLDASLQSRSFAAE